MPTTLIFDPEITPAVRDTAVQLRALAWGEDETPPLSFEQVAELTGKNRSTVYGHMRLLRLKGALRWRPTGTTEFIVSFEPGYWLSKKLDKPVKLTSKQDAVNVTVNRAPRRSVQNSGQPDSLYPLAKALSTVCRIDFEANRGRLFREAKLLAKANPSPTPELVAVHYSGQPGSWWKVSDWRGKDGQLPNPPAIRETWGRWINGATPTTQFTDYS